MDFYDIEPRAGSHYLLKNGQEIARFDQLERAEKVRAGCVAAIAASLDRAQRLCSEGGVYRTIVSILKFASFRLQGSLPGAKNDPCEPIFPTSFLTMPCRGLAWAT
jgi:hypothetical protein